MGSQKDSIIGAYNICDTAYGRDSIIEAVKDSFQISNVSYRLKARGNTCLTHRRKTEKRYAIDP